MSRVLFAILLLTFGGHKLSQAEEPEERFAIAAKRYAVEDWERAAEAFEEIIEQAPDSSSGKLSRFFLGESLVQLGRFADARQHFERYVALESDSDYLGQAIYRVGEAALLTGDQAAAQTWLERFHDEYPEHPLTAYSWPYLGDVYFETEQLAEAQQAYSRALTEHPAAPLVDHCRFGLARVLELQGQPEEAERFLELLTDSTGRFAEQATYELIRLRREAGDRERVVSLCQAYLTRFSEGQFSVEARVLLAEVELFEGHLETAWEQLRPLLDDDTPLHDRRVQSIAADVTFRLAEAYLRESQNGRADPLLEIITQRWPESSWADDALERRLRLAMSASDSSRIDRLAEAFHAEYPTSELQPYVDELWARSLYQREQFDEAIRRYQAAWEGAVAEGLADSVKANLLYLQGLAYLADGQAEHAIVRLEEAFPLIGLAAESTDLTSAPSPLRTGVHLALAKAYSETAQHEAAIQQREAYLALHPDGEEAEACRLALAQDHLAREEYARAWQAFQPLLADSPHQPASTTPKPDSLTSDSLTSDSLTSPDSGADRANEDGTPADFASLNPSASIEDDPVGNDSTGNDPKRTGSQGEVGTHEGETESASKTMAATSATLASSSDDASPAESESVSGEPTEAKLPSLDSSPPAAVADLPAAWERLLESMAEGAFLTADWDTSRAAFGVLARRATSPVARAHGWSGTAWVHYKQADFDGAAEAFERCLREREDGITAAEAAYLLGRLSEKRGARDAAVDFFLQVEPAASDSPHVADSLLRAARLLKQQDDATAWQRSHDLYRRLWTDFVELDANRDAAEETTTETETPSRATDLQADAILYELAWLQRRLGEPNEARETFLRLLDNYPKSSFWCDTAYRVAEDLTKAGELTEANRWLEELLARDPESSLRCFGHYLRGQNAARQAAWSDVIEHMQAVLDTAGSSSELLAAARYWLGEAHFREADYTAAAEAFEHLVEHPSGVDSAWLPTLKLRLAQIAGLRQDWIGALAAAEDLVDQQNQLSQPFELDYLRGRCFSALGRFSEARQAYQSVLRSPSGAQTETAAKAQWMIGESFFHQEDYDAAITAFEKVEVLYGYPQWQSAALLQAGKCYEQSGRWKQAVKLYARLLREFPESSYAAEAGQLLKLAQQRFQTQR